MDDATFEIIVVVIEIMLFTIPIHVSWGVSFANQEFVMSRKMPILSSESVQLWTFSHQSSDRFIKLA